MRLAGRRGLLAAVAATVFVLLALLLQTFLPSPRRVVDSDAAGTRQNLLRMIAIKERLPELIIVPAHDMRAFAEMSTLPPASGETRR